jgi:hypothetical protein
MRQQSLVRRNISLGNGDLTELLEKRGLPVAQGGV